MMRIKTAEEQLNEEILNLQVAIGYAKAERDKHSKRYETKDIWGSYAPWLWGKELWLLRYHKNRSEEVYKFLHNHETDLRNQLQSLQNQR